MTTTPITVTGPYADRAGNLTWRYTGDDGWTFTASDVLACTCGADTTRGQAHHTSCESPTACPTCDGTGDVGECGACQGHQFCQTATCPTCDGTGEVPEAVSCQHAAQVESATGRVTTLSGWFD